MVFSLRVRESLLLNVCSSCGGHLYMHSCHVSGAQELGVFFAKNHLIILVSNWAQLWRDGTFSYRVQNVSNTYYYVPLEKVNRVSSLGMFVKIKNVQKNKPSFDTNWLKISKCIVNDQLKYWDYSLYLLSLCTTTSMSKTYKLSKKGLPIFLFSGQK